MKLKKGISIIFLSIILVFSYNNYSSVYSLDKKDNFIPISNKYELNNIRNNLNGNYYLTADINFTEEDFKIGGDFYNNGQFWIPIGDFNNPFNGVIDGNGYTISGIKINSGYDCVGLIGSNYGTVQNLSIKDFQIDTILKYIDVGVFVGYNTGIVYNCTNFSNITYSGEGIGGIVGLNRGSVEKCSNYGTIQGETVGGIVAHNDKDIINCYNEGKIQTRVGNINSSHTYSGGIAGISSGNIKESYNIGEISSSSKYPNAGGITGYNDNRNSLISNCYNTALVNSISKSSQGYCGGIVAYNVGKIENAYNTGVVSSTLSSGFSSTTKSGIVAYNQSSAVISNCYYVEDGSLIQSIGTTKLTLNQMKNKDSFNGFDFDTIWIMKNNLPKLREITQVTEVEFKDQYLRRCVATVLKKSATDIITDKDMEALESLEVMGITSLEGLQNAVNLKSLVIDEQMSDIDYEILAELPNLTDLYINYYEDSSVTANNLFNVLPKLTGLKKLALCEVGFNNEQLSKLGALTELEELDLYYNFMENISNFPNLPNLRVLDLGANRLTDNQLTYLYKLKSLEELNLYRNNLTSIEFLYMMSNLKKVDVRKNKIDNFDILNDIDEIKVNADSITFENIKFEKSIINDGTLEIENTITDYRGQLLEPTFISNGGILDENYIKWNYIQDINKLIVKYDSLSNYIVRVTIPIDIVNTKPIIIAENITINQGDSIDLFKNVHAIDNEDGDITDRIEIIKGDINSDSPGEYEVIYSVTDNYGITVTKSIYITVLETYKKEDINMDGNVDILDMAEVALKYNISIYNDKWDNKLDINKDYIIDLYDLILIAKAI